MAIIFVSPKQKQKLFVIAVVSALVFVLVVISLIIFLSKPKAVSDQNFFEKKPEIVIDFSVLEKEQIKLMEIPPRPQMQFDYTATGEGGKFLSGRIVASSEKEALSILESRKISAIQIKKTSVGRINPFLPYYQVIAPAKK